MLAKGSPTVKQSLRPFPFSYFVLFHPRSEELFNERYGKIFVQRKMNRGFCGFIFRQFFFVFRDDRRAQIKSDIPFHESEPSYAPLVISRHSVTYALHCIRCDFFYYPSHRLKFGPGFPWSLRDVSIHVFKCFHFLILTKTSQKYIIVFI